MAINPIIKQKAEDIRKKIFGSEIRESLASGIEAISEDVEATIGRQGYVEEQFQDVLDETTGKDVISAPELIAARNGKSNLKTRLDDEHAQVTAQLQQTTTKLNEKAEKTEVLAVDSRVDNLVIPLSVENSNIQVTDALVSSVKNKTFTTVRNRFEDLEKDMYLPLTNHVKNSRFKDLSNWTDYGSGQLSVFNNIMTVSGDGSDKTIGIMQSLVGLKGSIYVKVLINVPNTQNLEQVRLIIPNSRGGAEFSISKTNIINNDWIEVSISGLLKSSEGHPQIVIACTFSTASDTAGKTLKVKDVVVVKTDNVFGVDEIKIILEKIGGFEGDINLWQPSILMSMILETQNIGDIISILSSIVEVA